MVGSMSGGSVPALALALAAMLGVGLFTGAGAQSAPDVDDVQEHQLPGQFILRNNIAFGQYVSFTYDGPNATVRLFAVGGTTFFETLTTPKPFEIEAAGNQVVLAGDGFDLVVFDHPTALVRFSSDSGTFLLKTPNTGVTTQYTPGAAFDTGRVDFTAGKRQAYLTKAPTPAYFGVTANNGSLFKLAAASVRDLAYPHPFELQVEQAIQQGHVAAQYNMLPSGTDVLSFQDVEANSLTFENGTYRFVVNGHFDSGRSFVVNFAPGVFQAENLDIMYYDEAFDTLMPADIVQGSSIDDVLRAEPGEGAEYWWAADPSGTHVFVSIPSFSIHAFDVLGIPPELVPIILYGLIGGFLFSALAAAGMFIRPRRA